jgi:2-oxoglutarate dehydrogenase E2 component (dihydrolipoamide succinyltransferase)
MESNREPAEAQLASPIDVSTRDAEDHDPEDHEVGYHVAGDDGTVAGGAPASTADDGLEPGKPFAASPAGAAAAPSSDAAQNEGDALSPAVRRLVRQYDLDITGIHGTGPMGRIRVGDVIGMLGGRSDGATRIADRGALHRFGDETIVEARGASAPYRGDVEDGFRSAPAAIDAAAPAAVPATTVFECDLTRALLHRKTQRRNNVETLVTSYLLAACGEALRAVPEVVTCEHADAQLGVLAASAEGERTTLVDAFDTVDDAGPLAPFNDRLRAFDQALRTIGDAALDDAHLLVHDYGASGSVLATPTPLGPGHVASVGFGRVRRQVVVKPGEDAPRVAAVCYLSLTYLPERVTLARANRFVAQLVRVLEQWPD